MTKAGPTRVSNRPSFLWPTLHSLAQPSEDDYQSRPEFTEPEILRTNLASVILQMAALGLGEVESFPFIDPPDRRSIRDGVVLLEELGAVDAAKQGTNEWLTGLGRRMARLPVDPRLAREDSAAHDLLLQCRDGACAKDLNLKKTTSGWKTRPKQPNSIACWQKAIECWAMRW